MWCLLADVAVPRCAATSRPVSSSPACSRLVTGGTALCSHHRHQSFVSSMPRTEAATTMVMASSDARWALALRLTDAPSKLAHRQPTQTHCRPYESHGSRPCYRATAPQSHVHGAAPSRASERERTREATSDEMIKQRELKLTLSSQWLRSEEGHSFTALGWGYLNRAMRFFAFLSIFSRCRCCRCCCCATNKRSRKHTRRSSSILVDRVVG